MPNKLVYTIDLPAISTAVVFVNGILARNRQGRIWLWMNLFKMRSAVKNAKGCVQLKAGICSGSEVILVSYWKDSAALKDFFNTDYHKSLMRYLFQNPENLCLYNETYFPQKTGKYVHEPQGLALIAQNPENI